MYKHAIILSIETNYEANSDIIPLGTFRRRFTAFVTYKKILISRVLIFILVFWRSMIKVWWLKRSSEKSSAQFTKIQSDGSGFTNVY